MHFPRFKKEKSQVQKIKILDSEKKKIARFKKEKC
jgi:hypothetical protein